MKPGDTETYTVTVTNKDSSGCTASNFVLSTTPEPSGMTATFDTASVLLGPGQSAERRLYLTSTTEGLYEIPVMATNDKDGNYGSSAMATEMVTSTLDVKVATSCTTCGANTWVEVTVTARDGKNILAAVGASVTVTVTRADKSTFTLNGTIGDNATAVTSFRIFKSDVASAPGSWQIQAVVTLDGITGNNTATITVGGSDGGGGKGGGKPK